MFNPVIRSFAGWLPPFAVVTHRGRTSGRVYRTPLLAFPAGDHFVVALIYGAQADWVKNVRAQGGCEMVARRRKVAMENPTLRPAVAVADDVPAVARAAFRLVGTQTFLVLQRRSE